MKCPYCEKEYFEKNQQICEYCGEVLKESKEIQKKESKVIIDSKTDSKVRNFLEGTGLSEIFRKIKKNLKE
ncbi:MAG: hypothetical protein ACFFA8_05090 [Promethearchaeota archaeon]